MKELGGKRVLVTGAGDGIGRGAALAFAGEGSKLLLVDIDGGKLESVEGEVRRLGAECRSYMADVSDPARVESLDSKVEGDFGGVDVLLNNAGVCVVADIVDTTLDDWSWIIGVNLYGPIHMIRRFLPGMRERRAGHIVNVASAGGLVHFGMLGAYCATKAGLVALSGALSQEVRSDGVGVTAFCPGFTHTRIVERMRFRGYSREKTIETSRSIMRHAMSTEGTGQLMVDAVKRDKALVVTTTGARIVVLLSRLFPGLVRYLQIKGRKSIGTLFK